MQLSGSPKMPLQSTPSWFLKIQITLLFQQHTWTISRNICLFWRPHISFRINQGIEMTLLFLPLVASFYKADNSWPYVFYPCGPHRLCRAVEGLFVCAWLFVIVLKCEANCVAFERQNCQFFLLSSPYVSNISVTITFIYQSLCYFDFL